MGTTHRGAGHLLGRAEASYSHLGGLRRGFGGWGLGGWGRRHKGGYHIQGSRGRSWLHPLKGRVWGWGPSVRDGRLGLTRGGLGTGWGGLC